MSLSDDLHGPDTDRSSRLVISGKTDEAAAVFDEKVSTVVCARLLAAF